MLESPQGLRRGLQETLDAVRGLAGGRYACILDRGAVLFESPIEPEHGRDFALRQLLAERRPALFAIPASMASGGTMEDAFADWHEDEFLLAFLNGRVALVVACPDAQRLERVAGDLLRVWADRMLRLDSRYRLDARGRGLFLGQPRLDVVVVGGTAAG